MNRDMADSALNEAERGLQHSFMKSRFFNGLLMAAAVLVNFAPHNPYLAAILKLWQQGHFLNFNGLTRLVSWLWPLAAIAFLIYAAARRRDEALR